MALKSMKITKADRDARKKEHMCVPYDGDDYPYGLRISLDEQALKKLGLSKLPKTGATVTLTAECCVVSTSVNDRKGKSDRRVELQIERMDLETPKGSVEDAIDEALEEAGDE